MKERLRKASQIFKLNWKEGLGVSLTFTVYLMFFPGVTLNYKLSFISSYTWFVIFTVSYASILDTFGRLIAGWVDVIPKKWYLPCCLLRLIVFSMTFSFTMTDTLPEVFQSDWFILTNLGLFAYSCGHFGTIGMKFGCDKSTGDQSLAATVMAMWLMFGIFIGSSIAVVFFS